MIDCLIGVYRSISAISWCEQINQCYEKPVYLYIHVPLTHET